MINTSTIRIANRELAKAGYDASKAYEACDDIEERLDTESAVKARCYADSFTFTIEVGTDFLIDTVNFLQKIKLLN